MIHLLFHNWFRHRQRLILLLIGALVISSGLSYLLGLSETSQGTVEDALQKNWKSSYDIVVRPPNTRTSTEGEGLLDPNYLSGIPGGISMNQYHDIQQVPGVDVAAPVAILGYVDVYSDLGKVDWTPGVYRITMTTDTDMGPTYSKDVQTAYYAPGWSDEQIFRRPLKYVGAAFDDFTGYPAAHHYELLAAVDPVQEAKLAGLDKAVIKGAKNHYFGDADKPEVIDTIPFIDKNGNTLPYRVVIAPVLVAKKPYTDTHYAFTIQKLNIPAGTDQDKAKLIALLRGPQSHDVLDQAKPEGAPKTYTYTEDTTYRAGMKVLQQMDPEPGHQTYMPGDLSTAFAFRGLTSSPLTFSKSMSPFPARWPYAFSLNRVKTTDPVSGAVVQDAFRRLNVRLPMDGSRLPLIHLAPRFIGYYDPSKLAISKDPTNELPLETYRPAEATHVLDDRGQPVNPQETVKPDTDPAGFIMSPPTLLTTLDAAQAIYGDKPISAIRIKVAGVDSVGEASQKKIEQVAKEIRDKTGLITDITLGSSPQPTLVKVPSTTHFKAFGWLEQPFVKLGAAITIFRETRMGMSGVILAELLVAIVYVLATSLVSFMARRKEFALLLAVGWRPSRITRMLLMESLIMGVFVAAVSIGMEYLVKSQHHQTVSWQIAATLATCGIGIYLIGAAIPARMVRRISPYETMRTGEVTAKPRRFGSTKGTLMMALSNMLGKWNRSMFSVFSIAVPTTLLVFFLFITFRLKGILYTTWLGQYVSMQVGTAQYIAVCIALAIAVLTTAEIMWQNISERGPEIALLKAVGWRDGAVKRLVLFEGMFSGLAAGIIGIVLGLVVIVFMYRQFPASDLWFIALTGVIPAFVGLIGAWLPAELATGVVPGQGMRGVYTARRTKSVPFKNREKGSM